MKKLHLLILRSFFGPFILIFFIVLFVLLMQFLWRYIDELVGKGLDFGTIAEFLMYTSATLVPMALPLSILMSSLMTFGNLGEHYELSAIKSSGISLQRIMVPLFVIVLFISFGAFFFANNVLPFANLQMRSLLYDIRQQRPDLKLNAGEFNNMIDGYSMRIGAKNPKSNTLYHIQIYDHTLTKGNSSVTIADSGVMKLTTDEKYVILTLFSGHSYNELQDQGKPMQNRSYPHRYDAFDEEQIIIGMSGFNLQRSDQSLFKSHYAMMNLNQLQHVEDSLDFEIEDKQAHVNKMLVTNNLFKKRNYVYRTPEEYVYIPEMPAHERQPNIRTIRGNSRAQFDTIRKYSQRLRQKQVVPNASDTGRNKKQKDTTQVAQNKPKIVNIDSIIGLLTINEKIRVSSTALTYARSSKNVVENSIQAVDYKIKALRRYQIEWHRKFTIAFACLVFLFIGAPLGAIIRKGGLGLPLVLSVIFFIFYYILSLSGEKMVRESIIPSIAGMWTPSAIFLITGIFLTYKATTDSSMLNLDTYLNFLKRVFGQRYNIIDKIGTLKSNETVSQGKVENIVNSLINLDENLKKLLDTSKNNRNVFVDEIINIFTFQTDNNLFLFARNYNNTFRIIIDHSIFQDKNVRAKIAEFPALTNKEFHDEKWKLVFRVISTFSPLIVFVIIRHLVRMYLMDMKLKQIKSLIPDLVSIINLTQKEL